MGITTQEGYLVLKDILERALAVDLVNQYIKGREVNIDSLTQALCNLNIPNEGMTIKERLTYYYLFKGDTK